MSRDDKIIIIINMEKWTKPPPTCKPYCPASYLFSPSSDSTVIYSLKDSITENT